MHCRPWPPCSVGIPGRNDAGTTLSKSAQFANGSAFDLWISDGIVRAIVQDTRALPASVNVVRHMEQE